MKLYWASNFFQYTLSLATTKTARDLGPLTVATGYPRNLVLHHVVDGKYVGFYMKLNHTYEYVYILPTPKPNSTSTDEEVGRVYFTHSQGREA